MSLPPRSSGRRSAWRSSSRPTRPRHALPIGPSFAMSVTTPNPGG